MKKGYLTVYLSLTLAILMSFIFTMVEGARHSSMRLQIETVTDMGLDSVFSEYHRELLKQYDLFFVDTGYGQEKGSVQETANRLEEYMTYNFQPKTGEAFTFFYKDFMDLSVCNIAVDQAAFATDQQGAVIKRQAISYMKDKYLLSYFDLLKDQTKTVTSKNWRNRNIEDELNSAKERLEKKRDQKYEDEEIEEVNDSQLDEFTDIVDTIHNHGILNLVAKENTNLSNQSVLLSQCVSQRKLNTGCGLTEELKTPDQLDDELFFGEYLLEKCGSYTENKEGSFLQYELEYILAGKNNDIENLKSVANTLLQIRAFSNLSYLSSDKVKQNEVKILAAVIAIAICVPEAEGILEVLLRLIWAYVEAIVDIRTLLDGGEVPLIKNSKSWSTGLSGLTSQLRNKHHNHQEEGISYKGYLRILLTFMNPEKKINRFMDIVEMDIRQTVGNEQFRLDQCVDYFAFTIAINSGFGSEFLVKKQYRYEM